MRIEGELLSLLQAAYFKRDAALLRLGQQEAIAREADAAWQRLVRVVENAHSIQIGKTHWIDVETGELNKLATVEIPPQPPAPEPEQVPKPKPTKRNKPNPERP